MSIDRKKVYAAANQVLGKHLAGEILFPFDQPVTLPPKGRPGTASAVDVILTLRDNTYYCIMASVEFHLRLGVVHVFWSDLEETFDPKRAHQVGKLVANMPDEEHFQQVEILRSKEAHRARMTLINESETRAEVDVAFVPITV